MIRKRSAERYAAISSSRKPLTGAERAWAELIASRVRAWEGEIPGLARLFDPVSPPESAVIVLENRGGEDAFTHDPTTIGFDLAALVSVYGYAGSDGEPGADRPAVPPRVRTSPAEGVGPGAPLPRRHAAARGAGGDVG